MPKVQKYDEDGNRLQAYPKGSYDLITAGDPTDALIDMGIASLKRRPPTYSPTEDGLEAFKQRTIEYFQNIKAVNENRDDKPHLIADIESWCMFLGITRKTLWNYRNGRGGAWADFIDRTKDAILSLKKQQAEHYKTPPMVYIFDAVNNFGYRNTNQVELVTDKRAEDSAILSDQLESAGLVWDDDAGDYIPERTDHVDR